MPLKISFTAASANDMPFLKEIHLAPGSFIVFDKGYVDYSEYQRMSNEGVFFVTRQKKDARYTVTRSNQHSQQSKEKGVTADNLLLQGTRTQSEKIKLQVRLISFFDK